MASGPKAPKRPRDPNQLAKSIVDLATGEAEDKKPLASARKGGLKGGASRAKALTPEQRSEIARAAASARWKKGA
ncbi:histone H1 [Mesorhizobium sp. M0437]|uniref:histone H1 n=1 Tax=Mesorhizobium sp. M0437 TaxID=2956945 RepID=UPI003334E4E6